MLGAVYTNRKEGTPDESTSPDTDVPSSEREDVVVGLYNMDM